MSFFVIEPSKFLDLVTLSNPDVIKTTSFDLETAQNGAGAFVAAIAAVTNANQGLPDYWVDVVFSGMTFPENDVDKQIILTMHAEALSAVQSFTPQLLSAALGFVEPAAVVGIINIESTFSFDGQANIFRLTFRLATTDAYLSYYENALPTYEVDDVGDGVTYIRFANTNPCAVQKITRVETVAPDGGLRASTVREVAYGDWEDRANLDYVPINQPIPVQTN